MYPYLYDDDGAIGMMNLSIQYIERPWLKLKDKWFPPSPEKLNKRIANYVDLYVNGGETAIPIIWDAIKQGGDANLVVPKKDPISGKVTGTEPLIVKAARNDKFFLVHALQAAGADLNAKDSNGETALIAGARVGSLEITSFLLDAGANATLVEKLNRDALFMAEASGNSKVAAYIKNSPSFNAAAEKAEATERTAPSDDARFTGKTRPAPDMAAKHSA